MSPPTSDRVGVWIERLVSVMIIIDVIARLVTRLGNLARRLRERVRNRRKR